MPERMTVGAMMMGGGGGLEVNGNDELPRLTLPAYDNIRSGDVVVPTFIETYRKDVTKDILQSGTITSVGDRLFYIGIYNKTVYVYEMGKDGEWVQKASLAITGNRNAVTSVSFDDRLYVVLFSTSGTETIRLYGLVDDYSWETHVINADFNIRTLSTYATEENLYLGLYSYDSSSSRYSFSLHRFNRTDKWRYMPVPNGVNVYSDSAEGAICFSHIDSNVYCTIIRSYSDPIPISTYTWTEGDYTAKMLADAFSTFPRVDRRYRKSAVMFTCNNVVNLLIAYNPIDLDPRAPINQIQVYKLVNNAWQNIGAGSNAFIRSSSSPWGGINISATKSGENVCIRLDMPASQYRYSAQIFQYRDGALIPQQAVSNGYMQENSTSDTSTISSGIVMHKGMCYIPVAGLSSPTRSTPTVLGLQHAYIQAEKANKYGNTITPSVGIAETDAKAGENVTSILLRR